MFQETLKRALKLWWCVMLTFSLSSTLFDGTLQKNLAVMAKINLWIVLQNFGIVLVVVSAFAGLFESHPFFKWSWFSLFNRNEERADSGRPTGTNINLMPTQVKYFGLLFVLLLAVNLPSLAMIEEKMFRAGTSGWLMGLYMSFLFGIVHCFVGVPIGAGLAITLAGLWFTHQYFMGGVELSALHHTTYNLILICILFLSLISKHIAELRGEKEG